MRHFLHWCAKCVNFVYLYGWDFDANSDSYGPCWRPKCAGICCFHLSFSTKAGCRFWLHVFHMQQLVEFAMFPACTGMKASLLVPFVCLFVCCVPFWLISFICLFHLQYLPHMAYPPVRPSCCCFLHRSEVLLLLFLTTRLRLRGMVAVWLHSSFSLFSS